MSIGYTGDNTVKKIICWASPGCHDNCGLLAMVENGRLMDVHGKVYKDIDCSGKLAR